jgi:GTPase SAR1 family protein
VVTLQLGRGGVVMAEMAVGTALIEVVIDRAVPAGLQLIGSLFHGKTIMVVGPGEAGKSTFVTYLQYGIFQEAQPRAKTYSPQSSPRFNLQLGPNRNLEVKIKTAVDLPGQLQEQYALVFEHRPHALVIILDMSAPLEAPNDYRATATWMEDFFSRLDQKWQGQKPRRNRLRSVIVALNKMDLADKQQVDEYEKRYRAIVEDKFRAARGPNLSDVRFRRTIMVENPNGTRSIDGILVDMAQSLTASK